MIPQYETVWQYPCNILLPRGRSAKFCGRREEPLVIVFRGKVDPSLTIYTAWFRILSATCPLRALHRCFRESTITRGFHPGPGAQGANLVSTIWSITGSDTEPIQEIVTQMSFETMGSISRGILNFVQISH